MCGGKYFGWKYNVKKSVHGWAKSNANTFNESALLPAATFLTFCLQVIALKLVAAIRTPEPKQTEKTETMNKLNNKASQCEFE